MINTFFKSPSFQERISFIFFVQHAAQNFSREYFKKSKLFCVLDYATDKVKSVRLKLVKALPKIRYMLNFDDEDEIADDLIDKFDKALSKLTN